MSTQTFQIIDTYAAGFSEGCFGQALGGSSLLQNNAIGRKSVFIWNDSVIIIHIQHMMPCSAARFVANERELREPIVQNCFHQRPNKSSPLAAAKR